LQERARSDLEPSDWIRQGHYFNPGATVEAPVPPAAAAAASPSPSPPITLPRAHASQLPLAAFVERYERPNLPVVLDGAADAWPAMNGAWTPANLYAHYRHRRFRCGEDDKNYPVKVKLKYFLRYMRGCHDDSPMYVFDSMYNDNRTACGIMRDYQVPSYFTEDLFRLVGEHRRPPYRWMLLGPKRSGTCVHIDPLSTSAWNTLIYGRKRWVLFPPDVPRAVVRGKDLVRKDRHEDDEAVDYFLNVLPRLKEREGKEWAASKVLEFTQYPGETVFVPGGWWHAVMNIDDTVAVTQNFCSTVNFERVWLSTREGRRGMARKWLRALRTARPDLAAVADALNKRDGWDPDALAQRHKERKAAKARRRAAKLARRAARAKRKAEAEEKARKDKAAAAKDAKKRRKEKEKAKAAAAAGAGMAEGSSSEEDSDDDSSSSSSSSPSSSSSSSSSSSGSSSSGSVTSDSSKSSGDEEVGSSAAAAAAAATTSSSPPVVTVKKKQVNSDDSSSTDGQNEARRRKKK
jgi:histone arginine demethylase JMJD6